MYIDMPEHQTQEKHLALFDDGVDAFIFADDAQHAMNAPIDNEHLVLAQEEQPAQLDFVWDDMEPAMHKMHKVQFEYDRAQLTQAEHDHLVHDVGPWAQEMYKSGRKICIKGHACLWHGTSAHNLALSNSRAHSVGTLLAQEFNIPSSHLQVFGVGNEEPIVFENSQEGQAPNRRAEIYALAA